MISSVMPVILMSICRDVMPCSVPATLKSMSPRWSSSPRMSESTANSSPSLMRPMAMPATGLLIGHAGVHQRQRGAAHRRHRGRPVRLGDLGDDADRVGELVVARHDRVHRAPGELAVADLAPAGAAHAPRLAHRERREVVVEHEALFAGALERVDELLVLAGAEGRNDKRLRLAAREQRRAVRARQHVHLRQDGAHGLQVAPVDALARLDDVVANDLALQRLERAGKQNLLAGITFGHLDPGPAPSSWRRRRAPDASASPWWRKRRADPPRRSS